LLFCYFLIPQGPPHDLSGGREGEGGNKLYVSWDLVLGQVTSDEIF